MKIFKQEKPSSASHPWCIGTKCTQPLCDKHFFAKGDCDDALSCNEDASIADQFNQRFIKLTFIECRNNLYRCNNCWIDKWQLFFWQVIDSHQIHVASSQSRFDIHSFLHRCDGLQMVSKLTLVNLSAWRKMMPSNATTSSHPIRYSLVVFWVQLVHEIHFSLNESIFMQLNCSNPRSRVRVSSANKAWSVTA